MPLHTDILPKNQIFQDEEAGSALDSIFKDLEAGDKPVVDDKPVADDKPVVDDKPAATDDADAGLPVTLPDDAPVVDDKPVVDDAPVVDDKPAVTDDDGRLPKFVADAVATKPVEDEDPVRALIKKYELAPSASQKSRDTFAQLKALSDEAVKVANQKAATVRAEYEAKLTAAQEAAKTAVPAADPKVEEELKKLREFRATFDIENDPEFQRTYNAKRDANYEEIYSILANRGLPESELKALRELPESERVEEIGNLNEKLSGVYKLKIQAKLVDNMNTDDARQQAIKAATEKALASRQEYAAAPAKLKEQTVAAIKAAAEQYRAAPVFKTVEIKPDTPPEEKKRLEAVNKSVEKHNKIFNELLADDTPQAKAEAAYGVVLAHHFAAQNETLTAQLKAANDELAAIKKRSGVQDKGRVVNVPTNKSGQRPVDMDAGSALDALAREGGLTV